MRIDSHTHAGFDPLFYFQGWLPYALDLTRLQNEAAGTGIDAFVVFPFIAYVDLDLAALRRNRIRLSDDPGAIPYAFENRRLCADLRRAPPALRRRFLPFLIGDPARRPREQVRQWRALPEDYAVYGLKFQNHTIQSPVLSLLDRGACMLDYAAEHDLPVLIHSSVHPDDRWSQCADILRVVRARPSLRFVLAHSCRFHRPTLEAVAALPNAWFDCASFLTHCVCAREDRPAVAPPATRFPADYRAPAQVLAALAAAFPDKLLWGSDAPYYSIEYDRLQIRNTYRDEVACLDALDPAVQARVCYRNTLAWLGRDPFAAAAPPPAGARTRREVFPPAACPDGAGAAGRGPERRPPG